MPSKDIWNDELAEGDRGEARPSPPEVGEETVTRSTALPRSSSPSASIIKTTADVPGALERIDRMKIDREWLARRTGKKK